jgi:hypothetical protein
LRSFFPDSSYKNWNFTALRTIALTGDFPKKGIFKGFFGLFFDIEEQSKTFLNYKPFALTSISSRKSWEIFATEFIYRKY